LRASDGKTSAIFSGKSQFGMGYGYGSFGKFRAMTDARGTRNRGAESAILTENGEV
jgi:hypothetical protein